ncbi:MAG: hypothetical protein ACUVTL_05155 [Thermoproteota archaeon]
MTEPIDAIQIQEATPFTRRAIVFAIFSSIAWIIAQSFMGPLSGFYVTGEGALAMVFLATILFQGRLHPFEQALIFGMIEVSSIAAIEIGAMVAAPLALNAFPSFSPLLEVVPDFFRISGPDLEAALLGGSTIPKGLAPTILIMFSINSAFFLLIVLTSFLLRKEFVEVEKLPFPVARASYTITNLFSSTHSIEQDLGRRIFWEGAIIGFLLVSVTEGYFVSQELPFLVLIPSSFNEPIFQSLNSLLPGAMMGFSWGGAVWTMWLLYLAPVESTLTAAAANFFAYMFLAPLQVAFNAINWDLSLSYDEFYSILYRGVAISYSWTSTGLLLSSATVPLVMSYRRFRKVSFEAQKLIYPTLALIILLSSVFIAAHLMAMPLLLSVFLVAVVLLCYNMWLTRSLAELNTIQPYQYLFIGSAWALGSSLMDFKLGVASREAYGTIATSYLFSSNAAVGAGCTEAFTIASLTGMRPRNMLFVLIFGVIIAALFGPLFYLSILYAFGFPSSPSDSRGILWSLTANSLGSDAALSYLIRGENQYAVNLPSVLAGFIAGLITILLRARFPSLHISVVAMGIGLATDPGSGFLVFLIPGLARLITMKVGGIKLYESFGLPLFTGISCGALMGALISSLNILRHL